MGLGVVAYADEPAAPTPAPAATEAPPAAPAAVVPDPTGANIGDISNVAAKTAGHPTLEEIGDRVGKNVISINIVWTLITGFLVMFMQAGFAMVESGLCRAKNVAHTMAMNLMIYPLGMLGFYVCGFAFMFGGVGSLGALGGGIGTLDHAVTIHLFGSDLNILGWKGFCLGPSVYDVSVFTLFLFQMVFMDTTATIPTGGAAERWKFSAFMLYGVAIGTVLYPVYGCWVWGGGWLAQMGSVFGLGHGMVDFAGSSVVHFQGGVIALIAAWWVGPRLGKYNKDGTVNVLPAHNVPMAVIGTFILAFGWFGFNPGSTLAGTDLRIAVVAVNTMLAGATGAMMATLWVWFVRGSKPDPTMSCNGMLAGLVAITAPCAFVNSMSACIIGIVAGILVVESVFFFERTLKIDDPVGAVSVHGACGAWGCIALGLFSDGTYGDGWNGVAGTVKGLFYGDGSQLMAEIVGLVSCTIYLGIATFVVFWVIEAICGHRVPAHVEADGLDLPEMGVNGYCGVTLDKASETPIAL
ncbi:MAG: ammonium transporter [Planctomycetes bacterium]|nr:ammonium transporter [Planctomycetota bacterium]